MTNRQRFHKTMRFGYPDHVPNFEEDIRNDVIRATQQQGLPRDINLSDLFQAGQSYEIALDFDPLSTLNKKPTSLAELIPH